jgi:hypothetical protein
MRRFIENDGIQDGIGFWRLGYSMDCPSFAMLPPFFEDIEDHVLEASLRSCFGNSITP